MWSIFEGARKWRAWERVFLLILLLLRRSEQGEGAIQEISEIIVLWRKLEVWRRCGSVGVFWSKLELSSELLLQSLCRKMWWNCRYVNFFCICTCKILWWYCTYVKKYYLDKLYAFYDTPSLWTLQLEETWHVGQGAFSKNLACLLDSSHQAGSNCSFIFLIISILDQVRRHKRKPTSGDQKLAPWIIWALDYF